MESAVIDPALEFMNGPLVTWVRTFESDGGGSLTYGALSDGVFLYDVMAHIDPPEDGGLGSINRHPDTAHARLCNLSRVLQHIIRFSQEVVGQQQMQTLPDLVLLSRQPHTAAGVRELRKLLLLLLACAVQSCHKLSIVQNIKTLDLDVQHSIVECIKEVTDNPESVWPSEWSSVEGVPEGRLNEAFRLLVAHLTRLTASVCLEWLRVACGGSVSGDDSTDAESLNASSSHLAVQLADHKAQLRRLRQDHDEKCEQASELKEELEQLKSSLNKVKQENVELVQDARAARAWRDESDILRERAARVDTLEAEVAKYKDKMADIQFYKTRVQELREDNKMLSETKDMLEQQLETSRKRSEQILELENKILTLKQNINQINLERERDREQLQELMEENAQLQMSARNSLNESTTLVAQIDRLKTATTNGISISSDLNSDAQTRLLKLQLENQRLEGLLESLRSSAAEQCSEKTIELEKENKRLAQKVLAQQESERRERTELHAAQEETLQTKKELQRLQDTLQTVRENADRQCKEMQEETSHLHELIESLRERQQQGTDTLLLDVESENKRLMDANLQLQSQVSRLGYEKQQLQRLTERLRESADRLMQVENQKSEMERENRELQQSLSLLRESNERHEELERSHASLEVEFTRVSRKLENSLATLSKLESVQSEKLQLQAEVERLSRKLESVKISSMKIADLEGEKEGLVLQAEQLQQQIAALQQETARVQQLEIDLMAAGNETQKLKRSMDSCQKKMKDIEKEKSDLESENSKLHRTVETLKLSTKKLNDLEKDLTELEGSNDRVERENRSLQKELGRLKEALSVKDNLAEEWSSKAASLQRSNQKLARQLETHTSSDNKMRELSQEKLQLEQQVQRERKTLAALREDLVAEKSRSGFIIYCDLSFKIVLFRYHALEALLEETLKSSLEVRDEKIASLESRLNESVARNSQLRQQLLQVRTELECVLLRQQEEVGESGLGFDASRQISSLKMAVDRINEEKLSLESEVSNLSSQASSYREQVCALQSQVTSLAGQNTVMSKHNASLQGSNARLQVENTTLQSQSASLIAQNTALQTSASQQEAERVKVTPSSYGERQNRLDQLSNDHDSLRRLHEQLQRDYDALNHDHTTLKQQHKNVKADYKLLQEKQSNLSASEDELLKMKEKLDSEMSNLKSDSISLSNLRAEHSKLKDDFRSLFASNDKLRCEYKSLQSDYKAVKGENNSLKLRLTELGGELNDAKDHMTALDVEVSKLTNKCQVLQEVNTTLEDARQTLMSQVSQLLTQYHDLLTQTLDDKHHFHQEEKTFADKLNNLQRQKEKLEEKIMEQYRRMNNAPNNKLSPGCVPYSRGFGSNLVRRVRKAGNDLISKVPRTGRSRSRGREDGVESPDSSSLGSSSHAHESSSLDSGSETRHSSPTLPAGSSSGGESIHADPLAGVEDGRMTHYRRRESLGTTALTNGSLTTSLGGSVTLNRKSMPLSVSEFYLGHSLRGSVSSEEVAASLRSSDLGDSIRDEELSSLMSGAPSLNSYLPHISSCSISALSNGRPHNTSLNFSTNHINTSFNKQPSSITNGISNNHHNQYHHHSNQSHDSDHQNISHHHQSSNSSMVSSSTPTPSLTSSMELARAGSRRPLCLSDDQDSSATRDSESESRSRPASRGPQPGSQYGAQR
ncbi:girdin [Hyalella azteca]|uniref:Girdin n=1 Tax=Hyalella azteca TaxID=294128 RepID=A0A979FKV2_HYAAZ|nr:girdin [Hyalella azteca]